MLLRYVHTLWLAELSDLDDLTPLSGLGNLQRLHVSGTWVTDLTPLSGLVSLQTLDVSRTQVTDLTPLAGLASVQSLDLSETRVTDLTPLSGLTSLQSLDLSQTRVTDLTPLAGLTSLQWLDFSQTQVTDLTPLSVLVSLQTLIVEQTQVSDLTPPSGLGNLQTLHVSETRVTDFTPLSRLTSLQRLGVSQTQITDLTPLSGLASLQKLYLSGSQGTDLVLLRPLIEKGVPVKWSAKAWESDGIYVEGCPLTNPPAEVVRQGNEAILNYFREKEVQGADHPYEAKMLIVGEGGAGKTSLLRRLYQTEKPLPEENETTKGIAIHRHEFPLATGRRFRLNVWDFGGQEIYKQCLASYADVDVLELLDGIGVDRLPAWTKEETLAKASASQSEQSDRTIKIFLASSSELREDRDAFDLYFRQQNDLLRKHGVYLEIIRWEKCLDAMAETRLQDEYNKEVRDCDVFVSLFFTKTGKFTREEFDTAYRQFKKAGKPLIYTFFKNADIKTGSAYK